MKPEYIKKFEELGLGMFVHFGLYSMVGRGEWIYEVGYENKEEYFSPEFAQKFNPKKNWARDLVRTAKKAGAKYITLTTKHHEGYCLYDSCGLTDWDVMHYGPKRDLVKEFVDECNKQGIVPFFYHAILDWHCKDYQDNFPAFIDYLVKSVELLCKNYGKIGGLWFDGYWNKPQENWQFDRLYATIRKYQPEAMIINNTGTGATGVIGHYEIDSVTFERGKPSKVINADGKERAGEMCEIFGEHWGYAANDYNYKSFGQILSTLIECRYCNCNLLMNTGPKGDGSIRPLDKIYLEMLGKWIKTNKNFIYHVKRAENFECENAKVFTDGKYFYAVVENVFMMQNPNYNMASKYIKVTMPNHKIKNAIYLDSKEKVELENNRHSFLAKAFDYGTALAHRVIRFK